MCVLTAVNFTIEMPKIVATAINPKNLARLLNPRLRSRTTLIQSSINPTAPPPSIANMTKMPVRVYTPL